MSSAPIRIAVFGWYIPAYRRALFELLSESAEYEFTFFAPKDRGRDYIARSSTEARFRWSEARCWRIPLPFTSNSVTLIPSAMRELFRKRFDVLILPNDLLGVDVWLAALLGGYGKALCLWGHGYSKEGLSGLKDRVRGWLCRRASAVILYTDQTLRLWQSRGLKSEKLFVAPNALDTRLSNRIKDEISPQTLAEFSIAKGLAGRSVVLFVGRLLESKSPRTFIEACAEARKLRPDLLGILIGEGPLHHELAELIRGERLEEHVRLEGEIYEERLIAPYFLSSRACVAPSGAGLVVQHAFGYGVPMIVGDGYGGHGPEAGLVVHGVNGFVVPSGSVPHFAEAIVATLADGEHRRVLSGKAREVISGRYNLENMARGLLDAVRHASSQQNLKEIPS